MTLTIGIVNEAVPPVIGTIGFFVVFGIYGALHLEGIKAENF